MRFQAMRGSIASAKPLLFAAAGITVIMAVILAAWYFDTGVTAPNVIGMPVSEASTSLHDAGISIDVKGAEGTVTGQHPIGGEQWFRYEDFELTYTNDSGTHTLGGDGSEG